MRLPEFLKGYRRRHSLAQKQIAYTLGITREHYARIERGTQVPSLSLLRRMAGEFQVTFIYVISEDQEITRTLSDIELR